MRRGIPILALALGSLSTWRCGDDATGPGITQFITQITGGGAAVAVLSGTPPAAGGGFPGVIVTAPSTVMAGSDIAVNLHASGITFTRVYVQIEGTPRFYQLTLPAAVTFIDMTVSLAPGIEVPNFTCVFGLGTTTGQNYTSQTIAVN